MVTGGSCSKPGLSVLCRAFDVGLTVGRLRTPFRQHYHVSVNLSLNPRLRSYTERLYKTSMQRATNAVPSPPAVYTDRLGRLVVNCEQDVNKENHFIL